MAKTINIYENVQIFGCKVAIWNEKSEGLKYDNEVGSYYRQMQVEQQCFTGEYRVHVETKDGCVGGLRVSKKTARKVLLHVLWYLLDEGFLYKAAKDVRVSIVNNEIINTTKGHVGTWLVPAQEIAPLVEGDEKPDENDSDVHLSDQDPSDPDRDARIIKKVKNGMSWKEVAEDECVSRQTIFRIIRKIRGTDTLMRDDELDE